MMLENLVLDQLLFLSPNSYISLFSSHVCLKMYSFDIVKKNYVLVMITHESQRVKTKQQIKSEKFVRKLENNHFLNSHLQLHSAICH